jgi:hypothetical protein
VTQTHRLVPRCQSCDHRQQTKSGPPRTDNRDDIIAVLSGPTGRRFDLRLQIVTMLTR